MTVVLDAGVVIGLARGDHRWRDRLRAARSAGAQIIVPAVVVAETVRGAGPRLALARRAHTTDDLRLVS